MSIPIRLLDEITQERHINREKVQSLKFKCVSRVQTQSDKRDFWIKNGYAWLEKGAEH